MSGISDSGFSSHRQMVVEQQDIGEEIDAVRTTTPLPFLQIAVVEDVIYDPQILTKEDKDKLKERVANSELVDRMPRKSIVARVITRSANQSDMRPMIFLPGSPHDHQPVKPGEQVFCFFTDPYRSQRFGFWLWRCPEPLDVEDLNYTHGDRRFDPNVERTTKERAAGPDLDKPGFPNGSNETHGYILQGADKSYDDIVKGSKASDAHVDEPVPRFSPRPGDRVLQGSNNARVVLGMDRTGPSTEAPRGLSGTVDIVAGVGEVPPTDEILATGGAPNTVTNTRGNRETDKNPGKRNRKDNLQEGDPNFDTDKSRVYVSMSTDVDNNLGLNPPPPGIPPVLEPVAAAFMKSDYLRLVGREELRIVVGDALLFVDKGGDWVVETPTGKNIKLGSATGAIRGAARLQDDITIDASTDPALITWMTAMSVYVAALGAAILPAPIPAVPPVTQPPTTIKGKITSASDKTKIE